MVSISCENLTKIYRLYNKPADRLKEMVFRRPFHKDFVALDSISFTVNQGETLGIIGENGAGKSTLLKILSKTLSPTHGKFEVNGRISSLLDLGSGFHPEFSGLDNIYFYGSLLGIERGLMQAMADEIIEFSELGDFINYPIKTYSSGMFVRLAFSAATSVAPDILIVDEVISVGDIHFLRKSTDKILSFKERGKTIVFCSHDMYLIARLCDRVLWLKNGRIHMEGKPYDVIQEYETYQLAKNGKAHNTTENSASMKSDDVKPSENPALSLTEKPLVFVRAVRTLPSQIMKSGDDLAIRIEIESNDASIPYRLAVRIRTVDGVDIIATGTLDIPPFYGNNTFTLLFPKIQLRSSTFIIEAYAFDVEGVYPLDKKEALPIKIQRESIELGIVDLPHTWIIEETPR